MLTLDALRKYGTPKKGKKVSAKNELIAALNRGEISEKDLRQRYSAFRKQINAQVAKIQKSDITFLPGTAPTMRKAANLITTRDLVNEIAQGLQFYHSKSYSRTQRVAQRASAVAVLNERGIDITVEQWDDWRRFMQWFHATEYAAMYDSDSDTVQEVFEQGASSQEWERLFKEFKNNI